MKQKPSSRRRRRSTKSVLRLPDLERAKAAVFNSLNLADAKRGYRHATIHIPNHFTPSTTTTYNAGAITHTVLHHHRANTQLKTTNSRAQTPIQKRIVNE